MRRRAGVVSIDHAFQLSDATVQLMRKKQIFAVPTFTIFEYFAQRIDCIRVDTNLDEVCPFADGNAADLVLHLKCPRTADRCHHSVRFRVSVDPLVVAGPFLVA